MEQAIHHPGAALLTVLQPCPTYNQLHDKDWYAGKDLNDATERLDSLQDEGYDAVVPHDAGHAVLEQKMLQCMSAALQWDTRIPTGVFFQDLSKPRLLDQIAQRQSGYAIAPPAQQPVCDEQGQALVGLDALLEALSVPVTKVDSSRH